MTHPRLYPLCFDRSLDRKSTATLSLKQLRQLYQQSRTEREKDQCFNPKILDRLRTNNFNELVHMHMDPENDPFFANLKILHSFKGTIVLENENEPFSKDFYEKFLSLIDGIEGNLLLTFVDIRKYRNNFADRCAQILSRKLKRREKVFLMVVNETISVVMSHAYEISESVFIPRQEKLFFASYRNRQSQYRNDRNSQPRTYDLRLPRTNCGADIETLIAMINGDRFVAEKQHLVSILSLIKDGDFPRTGRKHRCDDCLATVGQSFDKRMWFAMDEPEWSDCVGCEFK